MQAFSPLPEKTMTGPRPDAASRARPQTPARADGDVKPFGAVFHDPSSRSGASKTGDPATAQTDPASGRTGPETPADGDPALDKTAVQDTETAATPAADPEDQASDAAPEGRPEQVSPKKQGMTGAAVRPDAGGAAVPVPDPAGATGDETLGLSPDGKSTHPAMDKHAPVAAPQAGAGKPQVPVGADARAVAAPARGADGVAPADPSQPGVPSASGTARASGAAGQAAPPWFVPENAVSQTGRPDAVRESRGVSVRGQDEPRLAASTPASGPANTAPPPTMPGRGADALTGAVMSALHTGGTGDAVERGREGDVLFGLEHRGGSANGTTVTSLASLARPEMAQSAAMQIAAAVQKTGPGGKPGIELTLTPQELGRVRLTFTQSETGMIVNVHADRAETLELLRRNIDTLAQEFLDIGYESAQFTFDREDGAEQPAHAAGATGAADAGPRPADDMPRPDTPLVSLSDRLDIRL